MIVRVNKTSNYTVMANFHLKDQNLSYKAKGLLSVVLSLPDDWNYSVAGLAALSTEKETAVKTILDELKDRGYLKVTKKMPNITKSGRIEYEWDFYEMPYEQKQEGEKQEVEILPLEILTLENQGQSNTYISNKDILNTNIDIPPITPPDSPDPVISPEEKLFEQFWSAYPQCFRKANKKGCKTKFLKIKNLKEMFPNIMASLEMQKKSKQWNEQDGQFIPAPLTWINQERWTVQDSKTELQTKIDDATKKNINGFLL